MRRRKFKLRRVVEEIVFGVEDSLVSTLGALTGIAVGTQNGYVVVLSGVVLIFAEALSMTAGSYLSSKSEGEVWMQEHANDWDKLMRGGVADGPIGHALKKEKVDAASRRRILAAVETQRKRWLGQVVAHEKAHSPHGNKKPAIAAVVMAVSYLAAGIIPLGAYLVLPISSAIAVSITVTAIALFVFGAWKATLTSASKVRSGLEMLVVAGAAVGIAYLLGLGARMLFGIVI